MSFWLGIRKMASHDGYGLPQPFHFHTPTASQTGMWGDWLNLPKRYWHKASGRWHSEQNVRKSGGTLTAQQLRVSWAFMARNTITSQSSNHFLMTLPDPCPPFNPLPSTPRLTGPFWGVKLALTILGLECSTSIPQHSPVCMVITQIQIHRWNH